MRRFGWHSLIIVLIVSLVTVTTSCEKVYDEKEMGRLATLTRVVMDIVRSQYIESQVPAELSEPQIIDIVVKANTDFEELKMLDKYDMEIVSDGANIGAVVWDPGNDRKLIQDLRCTKYLDDPAWRNVFYGKEFTLNWDICTQ